MKKAFSLVLAMLMVLGLSACGETDASVKDVDLTAYYDAMSEKYDWADYMTDMTDDMVDTYYPGLRDIETTQFIAKAPLMSAVVSEVVLMECTSEDDAAKAAEILNQRVSDQAGGGAWYPESMDAWKNAQVVSNGTYVALLAYAEDQTGLSDAYSALFAA